MRTAITAFVLLLTAAEAASAQQRDTLRIDYFHSGNAQSESFSLDEVVREPLAFPGNERWPLDRTRRGKYLFEVIDGASNVALWSRSFSSIYGEWETTGEARRMNRTFHESLRFPAPSTRFELVIKKRNAQNEFDEIWRIGIDPQDYLVHRESAVYTEQVIAIEQNGDPAQKVDVLLLGDGFTVAERELFLRRAQDMADALFATPPFRERRQDFNVWALAPAALESGVSRPSTGIFRESPARARYDAFRSERYVLTFDNKSWRRIASSAPYDFVEILVNSDVYGGGGIYGLYSTAAVQSEWAPYLFVHEFAHHFAGLADEYYTSSVAYETPEVIIEPYEPNVTALLESEQLKWRHLVPEDTPLPTPWPKDAYEEHSLAYQARRAQMRAENVPESEMNTLFRSNQEIVEGMFSKAEFRKTIGAFRGANYDANSYYRSELNCIMFTRTTDFCRVCRDAIEQVIDEYTKAAD